MDVVSLCTKTRRRSSKRRDGEEGGWLNAEWRRTDRSTSCDPGGKVPRWYHHRYPKTSDRSPEDSGFVGQAPLGCRLQAVHLLVATRGVLGGRVWSRVGWKSGHTSQHIIYQARGQKGCVTAHACRRPQKAIRGCFYSRL